MNKQLFVCSIFVFAIVLPGRVYAQERGSLVVHFPFDGYKLSGAAKGEIDSFFRVVARRRDTAARREDTAAVDEVRVALGEVTAVGARDTMVISGYTDSIGGFGYNENLSVRRALAVKGYVVAKGLVAAGRIKIAGYGQRHPLAGNGSDAERAVNRRAEIFFPYGRADTVTHVPPVQRDSLFAAAPDTASLQAERAVVPIEKRSAVVAVPPKQTIYDAVMDSTVAVGSTIPLRDVNFFASRHIPLPVCNLILDELARAMKANPKLRIRIEGHICCLPDGVDGADLGTGQPNLSVQRAKYVYDYLARLGIAKKRMSYIGLGASGKLYPLEENEEQRAENRRVEIRVMAR